MKTRLAATVGKEAARTLYESFLSDLSFQLLSSGWIPWVDFDAPGGEAPFLERLFPSPWRRRPQAPGDLGERISVSIETRQVENGLVIVCGSDAPLISRELVSRAFDALEKDPIVVSPASDGGFSLIGLQPGVSPRALLFQIRWSTRETLEDVRRSAASLKLRIHDLPGVDDADEWADLLALRENLKAWPLAFAPATRKALLKLGL